MSLNKYSSTTNRLDIDTTASPSFRAYVHAKAANIAPTLLAELVMFRSSQVVTVGVEGSTTALIKSSKACAVLKKSLVGKTTESLRASKACSVFQGIVRPPTCNAVVWEAYQQLLANAARPSAPVVKVCTDLVKYQPPPPPHFGPKVIHTRPFDHGWLLPASLATGLSLFPSSISMLKHVNTEVTLHASATVNILDECQIPEVVPIDNNGPQVQDILPTPPASPTNVGPVRTVNTISDGASHDSPKRLSKDELFKAFGMDSSLTPQAVHTPRPTKDQLFKLFGLNNGLPTPPVSPTGILSPLSSVDALGSSAAASAVLLGSGASDAKAARKAEALSGESLMEVLASLQSTEKSTRKSLGAPLPRLLFSDPAIVTTCSDTTSLDDLTSQYYASSMASVPCTTPSTAAFASSSPVSTKPRSRSLANVVRPTRSPEVKVALTRADIVKREQARFFIKNIAFKSVHLSSAYVSSSTSGPPPPSQLHASESDVFAPGYVLYECDGAALRRLAGLSPGG